MIASAGSAVPRGTPPAAALGVSSAGFRKLLAGKKGKKVTASAVVADEVILSTAERMAKGDRPGKTKSGYRALGTIERLCADGKLDPEPPIAFAC